MLFESDYLLKGVQYIMLCKILDQHEGSRYSLDCGHNGSLNHTSILVM